MKDENPHIPPLLPLSSYEEEFDRLSAPPEYTPSENTASPVAKDGPEGRAVEESAGPESPPPKPTKAPSEGPQPLVREIPPGAPYPVAALGPLRQAVEAVQGMKLAPIAIPAASALSVASLAVMGHADVETLDRRRPTSLYMLTIAQSGERKTSCDDCFMQELRDYEKSQAEEHRFAFQRWQNEHAIWKGRRDHILNELKKAKGEKKTALEADLTSLGPEPAAPPSADRTVTKPTLEGLTRQFKEGQPALGIFSDEGAQFLGGYSMKSENRQAALGSYNDAWQGKAIKRTTQGEGSYTLYGRRLAIHLMAQQAVARDFMADPMTADIGFLPRCLICEPPSTFGTRLLHRVREDDGAMAAFSARLRAVLETPMPMNEDTRELSPRLLPLCGDARYLLMQFHDAIELQLAPGGALVHIPGYASKAAEQAARIAGVLTLWDDLHAVEVSAASMANGIAIAQFYLTEASRLANAALISAEIDRAEKLRLWLLNKRAEPEILVRDVVQNGPGELRETKTARAALKVLEGHGWVELLPLGSVVRGAARKEAWRIVRGGGDVV